MAKRLQIQFYNHSTGESLSLPINPKDVQLPHEMNTQSFDVIDFGEITRIGGRKCKRVTFNNMFPDDNSFLNLLPTKLSNILSDIFSVIIPQKDTIEKIERWMVNKDKIRVIISDFFNELMQIESFEPTIYESNETVYYTINFVEYRDPENTFVFSIGKDILSNGLLSRTVLRAIPDTIYTRAADDLFALSKRYTGSGSNWKKLAENNGISEPDAILTGKELNLKW